MPDPEIPSPTPEERELSRKLVELTGFEETLACREQALRTLEAELRVFEVHYLDRVGKRMAVLDALLADLAERELSLNPHDRELMERAEALQARAQESADALESRHELPDRRAGPPSDSLRLLFRKVARVLHPDLAEDEAGRRKREELMTAANLAYTTGNEDRLSSLLSEWEDSPEAVQGRGVEAELLRVIRHLARVQDRIDEADREARTLRESDLFHLSRRVEAAEKEGRDLLAEMAASLEPQIAAARERLAREDPVAEEAP